MCYSGGKDSTYTLIILKENYSLNILAITLDNGFLPEQTLKNIRNVVEKIEVDHILLKPRFDVLKKIFTECAKNDIYPPKTLERASTICTSCMGIIKFSVLRIALEKNVPFIIFGWSTGKAPIESSIMKNNPQMVRMMQNVIFKPLHKIAGDQIKPYFIEEEYFNNLHNFPYNINPLAFLEYNEERIYKVISQFGWEKPQDTDTNSTNCLLNSFANIIHKKHFSFHPYVFEIAKLVREGFVDREKALKKINKSEKQETVEKVKEKLKILVH
jgi:tRNA(Ile)-lysidine synthase TilS/MesJ